MKLFEWGFGNCDTPWDLGWLHGTEDIGEPRNYRPGCPLTPEERADYEEAYRHAGQGYGF